MDANAPLQNVALGSATLGALGREWGAIVPKLNCRRDRDIMDEETMLVGAALGGDAALGALGREWGARDFNGVRRGAQYDQAALNAQGREWGPTDVDLMVWSAAGRDQAALDAQGREWGPTDADLIVWNAAAGPHAALGREWGTTKVDLMLRGAAATDLDETL